MCVDRTLLLFFTDQKNFLGGFFLNEGVFESFHFGLSLIIVFLNTTKEQFSIINILFAYTLVTFVCKNYLNNVGLIHNTNRPMAKVQYSDYQYII